MSSSVLSLTIFLSLSIILSIIICPGQAKRGAHITPDILIRKFANEAENSRDAAGADTETRVPGLTMSEIMEALKHHYGLKGATVDQPSSRYLLELYQKLERGESLSAAAGHRRLDTAILQADTVRSIPAKDLIQDGQGKVTLTFSLIGVTSNEVMKRAELRIRAFRHEEGSRYRVRVVVLKEGTALSTHRYRIKPKRETRDGHALFDLSHIVQGVLEEGFHNATLILTLRRPRRNQQSGRSRRSYREQMRLKETMLVIFTRNEDFFKKFRYDLKNANILGTAGNYILESGTRGKRETTILTKPVKDSHIRRSGGPCGRRSFLVDFDTIGWGRWIIYPKQYNAYYCGGKCPNPPTGSFNPTNHAILQSLMRKRGKKIVPRPCCVPTKLRPISMLYFEENEIVVRRHDQMVVDECGCR